VVSTFPEATTTPPTRDPQPALRQDPDSLRAWVLSDGKAGTENQCLGLAEAIGIPFVAKRLAVRAPWRFLPARLATAVTVPPFGRTLAAASDPLDPPWPDLVIASGRQSVPYAVAVRRAASGRTFAVQVQDPRVDPALFDLVVPPRHDRLAGANVVPTLGALTRITPARLAEAAREFAPRLAHLPRPLFAVLIGGSNRSYRLTAAAMAALIGGLDMLTASGAGLAVTASRRTGAANVQALRAALAGKSAVMWDGSAPNPYFGYLALADAIVVTADSVSMTSEACTTGKPVYVASLPGGAVKFRDFHAALAAEGCTRPFTGPIRPFSPTRLDETARIAALVRTRLGLA
jgi:mitochondrial fission protein ELM1